MRSVPVPVERCFLRDGRDDLQFPIEVLDGVSLGDGHDLVEVVEVPLGAGVARYAVLFLHEQENVLGFELHRLVGLAAQHAAHVVDT